MRALAACLVTFAERQFRGALGRDPGCRLRPVLVGPPDEALREIFGMLTAAGQQEWQIALGPASRDVIVLLVDDGSPSPGTGLSRGCNWDYAVSVRNSCPLVLILASRGSWDKRPESLANTTETIGEIGRGRQGGDDPLRAHLLATVASRLGLAESAARELLRKVQEESARLEPASRDAMTWNVLESLLTVQPGPSPVDSACRAAGFPIVGNASLGFSYAYGILLALGRFVAAAGLSDAVDQMKATSAAQRHGVVGSLDSLYAHLSPQLFSPTLLETAPSRYYRVAGAVPPWYDTLSAPVLAEILAELDQGPRLDRLVLACTNALASASPIRGGPFVVATSPQLQAGTVSGAQPATITFTRKVDKAAPVAIAADAGDPLRAVDVSPAVHRKAIKYKVVAPNHRPGTVHVLSLDQFACGGLVVARDAERNGLPVHTARGGTWTQELALSRGGATELLVFHASPVAQVSVARIGEAPEVRPAHPGSQVTPVTVDLADNDRFEIVLTDATGGIIGAWTLVASVRDLADVASSRLDALIREHRTRRRCVPHAPDTALHRLELGSYLGSTDSWKPVLACWTAEAATRGPIDWSDTRVLGDVQPQIDPRPPISAPPGVLAAREAVRGSLWQENRCVSEIEISTPHRTQVITDYLRAYRDWLAENPRSACWLDVLAIHVAEWNAQAGRHVATEEPVVVLLSPLHPLRLAWHAIAQQQLADSLTHLCPGAGLLNPSHCPDSGLLYLWDGQEHKPRAFLSLPCEHPHWAVLINSTFLDRPTPRAVAMQKLAELGLQVQAITGGFTAQQAEDSLNEVNRLLPARATLRVGIVGDAESSSECGMGVFHWSERHLSQDEPTTPGCIQVEVFDTRGANDPTPEQLADLSEMTAERVRWFKLRPDGETPRLDLTIIDQLGVRSPEAVPGNTRSAVVPGCLFRARVREDFHEARAILESRVAATRAAGSDLPTLVSSSVQAYEELCTLDAGRSHFRFTPNQDAVGSRLQSAIFLSLTSSQIDPACIVRGTVGQSGYLWDYELPGILGGGESGLGYYLVAKPTSAMYGAVERAASLVASPPPNIPGLLEEVSRHGIPILKRLASGGSRSRGELGLLLATRLLQDAFRPRPTTARLPVWSGSCIHLVLPVDPYQDLFDRLRRSLPAAGSSAQRPDLVVVAIQLGDPGHPVAVKLTPVEIKYRAGGMPASDMREALGQAHSLGRLFQELWSNPPATELWGTCSRALLAQILDFGLRIYAAEWLHGHRRGDWAVAHQRILQDVLEGSARVTVNVAGRLVVFHGSPMTYAADLDGDQRPDTLIVSQDDARALLSGVTLPVPAADLAVPQLDFSFPGCGTAPDAASAPIEPAGTNQPDSSSVDTGSTTGPVQLEKSPAAPGAAGEGHGEPSVHDPQPPGNAEAPPVSRVPPEVRQRVRQAFDGFVGNEPAVSRLSNDLLRALIEQPPHLAKNYLFTGLPSTGKTELARRMARALDLPFVKLDGRSVSSRDKLFELVTGELASHDVVASLVGQQVGLPVLEYPPLIVFIDEVHLVPRSLQEALLTMLEAADRTVVLADHVARVHRATFLFATTRVSDVDAAFASRCDEIQLREYSEAEVAEILRRKLGHEDWEGAVYEAVARLGRCVPRSSIQLAEALETAVMVAETHKPLVDHLEDVRRAREIDSRGLTRMDFEYLAILERSGSPVGEQNILNLMRTVDKERILNDIEPFLVRLGFVRHGPRGRELTAEGREYLLARRAQGLGAP
jgi:DNA phosphorothioation-dependent restriction protein DptH